MQPQNDNDMDFVAIALIGLALIELAAIVAVVAFIIWLIL